MTYAEAKKRLSMHLVPLPSAGDYELIVTGFLPNDELVNFSLSISGCYSDETLSATIDSTLEELLNLRYDYIEGTVKDTLLYDGGNFNESN